MAAVVVAGVAVACINVVAVAAACMVRGVVLGVVLVCVAMAHIEAVGVWQWELWWHMC